MKVLLIEDETAAVNHLKALLSAARANLDIVGEFDTIRATVGYIRAKPELDLIFMDIQLADGLAFSIFDQVEVETPIIFLTAYDQYAIQAFEVNSIHYLLKPISREALEKALLKFENSARVKQGGMFQELVQQLQVSNSYKSTFLINHRDRLFPIGIEKVAFFLIRDQALFLYEKSGKSHKIDHKLEELEQELDPNQFYRANRQCIVHRTAIESLQNYFNGKLIMNTQPPSPERLVISKSKAPAIKNWLTQS